MAERRDNKMVEKFWMIYVEGKDTPTISIRKHTSLESAKNEAVRLAVLPDNVERGRKVYILTATSCCWVSYPPVQWQEF